MKTAKPWFYPMVIIGLLLLLFHGGGNSFCYAQGDSSYSYEPVSLFGPRIGFTIIGGETADKLRDDYDAVPFITQFGWQFEWRFFSVDDGPTRWLRLFR